MLIVLLWGINTEVDGMERKCRDLPNFGESMTWPLAHLIGESMMVIVSKLSAISEYPLTGARLTITFEILNTCLVSEGGMVDS